MGYTKTEQWDCSKRIIPPQRRVKIEGVVPTHIKMYIGTTPSILKHGRLPFDDAGNQKPATMPTTAETAM